MYPVASIRRRRLQRPLQSVHVRTPAKAWARYTPRVHQSTGIYYIVIGSYVLAHYYAEQCTCDCQCAAYVSEYCRVDDKYKVHRL